MGNGGTYPQKWPVSAIFEGVGYFGVAVGKSGESAPQPGGPFCAHTLPAVAGFKGQAENSIDGKGRMPVPAKMRRCLSPDAKETFVATRGIERCVFLYPLDVWEEIEAAVREKNQFVAANRDFVRTIAMWADELSLDAQGRIGLPKNLIEFAGLQTGNKALIIGAFDRIEVWDPDVFEAHLNDQDESYESLAERVMGGI